jgi:hypothetical protein
MNALVTWVRCYGKKIVTKLEKLSVLEGNASGVYRHSQKIVERISLLFRLSLDRISLR